MRRTNEVGQRSRHPSMELFEDRRVFTADLLGALDSNQLGLSSDEQDIAQLQAILSQFQQTTNYTNVHSSFGLTGAGQTVVVIDSGIAYDHPALGGGLGAEYRVVAGWDFAENDANPFDDAPAGFHGTHVAGIIGSSDGRYTGLAPDVDLVALRVFNDQGQGDFSRIEQALRWVHNHRDAFEFPVTTVNMSIGSNWYSHNVPAWSTIEDELRLLKEDGIFVAVAAGNSFDAEKGVGLSYPAASPHVVPVASADATGAMSIFSQRSDRVLVAPGENIVSTGVDYLFDFNGRTDDFVSSSGTSMASPFVAGASVLLRQAMELMGWQDITQDTLYEYFVDTASPIHDSITNAEYWGIDLTNAFDTLLADDFGGDSLDGHALGTIEGEMTQRGTITRVDDHDVFTFVAPSTGTVEVSVAAVTGSTGFLLSDGGGAMAESLSYAVQSGHTYSVDVCGTGSIGTYDVTLSWTPSDRTSVPAIDLGRVDLLQWQWNGGDAEQTFVFEAAHDGWATWQGIVADAGQRVDWECYDEWGTLLAAGRSNSLGRFDATYDVVAGQQYTMRLTGDVGPVDMQLCNLLSVVGEDVLIWGTSNDDTLYFQPAPSGTSVGTHRIVVDGMAYRFSADQPWQFRFQAGIGHDEVILLGSARQEQATIFGGGATLVGESVTGAQFSVSVGQIERVAIRSGGGDDRLSMIGSDGNEAVALRQGRAFATFAGFTATARGFTRVEVDLGAGEGDSVVMHGTSGSDILESRGDAYRLSGAGIEFVSQNADKVTVFGRGGYDSTYIMDSLGDDRFTGRPHAAVFDSADTLLVIRQFEFVDIESTQGGFDRAQLFDSAGDEWLYQGPQWTQFDGAGFSYRLSGFDDVRQMASRGGNDNVVVIPAASATSVLSTTPTTVRSLLNSVPAAEGSSLSMTDGEDRPASAGSGEYTSRDTLFDTDLTVAVLAQSHAWITQTHARDVSSPLADESGEEWSIVESLFGGNA
ncbi:MAG: S8 family serine peptidase [Pirellulaceae bacterium]